MTTENNDDTEIICGGLFTENGDTETCILCNRRRDKHAETLEGVVEIAVEGEGTMTIDRELM